MSRLVKIRESEVLNTALEQSDYARSCRMDIRTHLLQQLLQDDEEGHQVACVAGVQPLGALAAQVLGRSAHCRRNHLASGVHKQFGKPFEDFLDNLWVGFLEVCDGELDADICDASCNLRVGLRALAMRLVHERSTNQCHECIGFLRRRCAWVVSSMGCGARSHAHARVVGHCELQMRLRYSKNCSGTIVEFASATKRRRQRLVVSTKRWRGRAQR